MSTPRFYCILLAIFLAIAGGAANAQESPPPTPADTPTLTDQNLPEIGKYLGKTVRISGKVAKFRNSWSERAPNIITLVHPEKELEIVFWTQDTDFDLEPFKKIGEVVYAEGLIQDYRGKTQLKIFDLEDLSLKPFPSTESGFEESDNPNNQTAPEAKIKWEKYTPEKIQQELEAKNHAVVYVRTGNSPEGKEFEQHYMLNKHTPQLMGSRTVYYIEFEQQDQCTHVNWEDIPRRPALVVIKKPKQEVLVYKSDTTPHEVAAFMKKIPR